MIVQDRHESWGLICRALMRSQSLSQKLLPKSKDQTQAAIKNSLTIKASWKGPCQKEPCWRFDPGFIQFSGTAATCGRNIALLQRPFFWAPRRLRRRQRCIYSSSTFLRRRAGVVLATNAKIPIQEIMTTRRSSFHHGTDVPG